MLPAPPAPMASWAGSGLVDWHSARAGFGAWLSPGSPLALLPTSKRPEPSLPASPPSAPTPLHPLHPLQLTAAPLLHLLYPTSRCHDHPPTSSSFQHLHLHIPIQNPHLYEIGACYAGRPRSQQFLIQLFAVTPTRARREVPASWGPSLQAVPFLTVLCFRG
jgi:hypothetical protein